MSQHEENSRRSVKQTRGLLRRFISYYKPHRKLFAMDMGAALLVSAIGVVYPIITRTMLNTLIPERQYRMIVIFGLALLLLYFVKMMLNYFIQYQGHMMGVYMQARMRTDLFAHLETLPYSFFDNHETGKIDRVCLCSLPAGYFLQPAQKNAEGFPGFPYSNCGNQRQHGKLHIRYPGYQGFYQRG